MRINVAYPSAALLSRVLSTPKEPAEPVQSGARFAEAMDATLAGQMAVSAMMPVRSRLPARAPEKKDPRERGRNDDRASDQRGQDQRAQDQRRNTDLWA